MAACVSTNPIFVYLFLSLRRLKTKDNFHIFTVLTTIIELHQMYRLNLITWHTDFVQFILNKRVHSKAQFCFHYFMNNLQQFVVGTNKKKKLLHN